MTVALVTFGKSGTRKAFTLDNVTTIIGRKLDADLRIPLSDISREHCEFTLDDDTLMLRDLDSSNGTFVNDEKIFEDTPLNAGDHIRIGPVIFTVQIDGEPADITPASQAPAKALPSPADEVTQVTQRSSGDSGDTDEFDIDQLEGLEDMEIDDLSDLDLSDEIGDLEDGEDLEEIDDLEELSEDDILEDEKES
ncbi:MAG: FHA domain-containing protein [Phycisphaerae bacterium]